MMIRKMSRKVEISGTLYYPWPPFVEASEWKESPEGEITAFTDSQAVIGYYVESSDRTTEFQRILARIKSFKDYPPNWDSFGSEPPNDISINNAIKALEDLKFHELLPTKISPSSEEGVMFEFLIGNHYYLLEFCNSGHIVFLRRENETPKAFEISLAQLEGRIFEMKYGQQSIEL